MRSMVFCLVAVTAAMQFGGITVSQVNESKVTAEVTATGGMRVAVLDASDNTVLETIYEEQGKVVSDPQVSRDLNGRIYIAFAQESASDSADGGIFVITIEGAGKLGARSSWKRAQLAWNSTSVHHCFLTKADRDAGVVVAQTIACDLESGSPWRNHVYVVWIQENLRDGSGSSQVNFTKSRNGGVSFYVSNPAKFGQDGGAGYYLPFWRVSIGRKAVGAPRVDVRSYDDVVVGWTEAGQNVERGSVNGGVTWGAVGP